MSQDRLKELMLITSPPPLKSLKFAWKSDWWYKLGQKIKVWELQRKIDWEEKKEATTTMLSSFFLKKYKYHFITYIPISGNTKSLYWRQYWFFKSDREPMPPFAVKNANIFTSRSITGVRLICFRLKKNAYRSLGFYAKPLIGRFPFYPTN